MKQVFYIGRKAYYFGDLGSLWTEAVYGPGVAKPSKLVWWFPWNWVLLVLWALA